MISKDYVSAEERLSFAPHFQPLRWPLRLLLALSLIALAIDWDKVLQQL